MRPDARLSTGSRRGTTCQAGWDDGHYCAVIHLGGGYRYGAFFTPERNLHPAAPVTGEDAPVLAGRAA